MLYIYSIGFQEDYTLSKICIALILVFPLQIALHTLCFQSTICPRLSIMIGYLSFAFWDCTQNKIIQNKVISEYGKERLIVSKSSITFLVL